MTSPTSASDSRDATVAIVSVDDDPGVSRAVARDLRRRYGEHYRIVRSSSGAEALEALRELKLRGSDVALLIADHRMPEMNGIEFLEHALDLFPTAKRMLLTAYADTGAAIDAINVIDLDHYLLKPWDPPEQKLYPVVDSLLESWWATERRTAPATTIVGHRWSARSFAVRDFLARNQLPYRWVSAEDPEGGRLLAASGVDASVLPVVVTEAGTALVGPSDSELARHVGLRTAPLDDFYDLVVVGGGPAGLGAAVYGASEGLRTVLVERSATGGQAGQSSRIENYLGFPDGVSGAQLADRARRQVSKFGAEVLTTRHVTGIEARGGARVVALDDGTEIAGHTVVLATGVDYRTLDGPGLTDLTGRGVFYGSTTTAASDCRDADVYVVGGANSAGQAAIHFARTARTVRVVIRAGSLQASMSQYLIDQIAATRNIEVVTDTEVTAARGEEHLEGITLADRVTGATEEVPTNWLFVFIGATPRTQHLAGVVARDDRGFVLTGSDLLRENQPPAGWHLDRPPYSLESSTPGIFVAGDVRSGSVKRVASAVGEGALAVTLVHKYLADR
ncbi:NAD(P)/FAD-dependent oxidoreductase [Kocuria rosea]|uniref:FAD-dependent oxidoreductase n=1 Tax=Kocuria rosea TaxID=1275 RepID=UPI002040A5A0|nr:FAD-dependent oxidoreductase [Kocuria rosea]MCM3688563.1 FAD-dependent oxidoreductase [Kocuria rosea]HST72860.1 FAD-dependent oxidoreductase [Kocuria rosea]